MQRYTSHYQHNQITTASPGQLLLLAYDGAIRFLREGREAMLRGDRYVQSNSLVRTQEILQYLRGTINHGADPELAANLDGIYGYLLGELTQANVNDDAGRLDRVAQLLASLRGAWEEAELQARAVPGLPVGVSA